MSDSCFLPADQVRNIAIVGHVDHGKSSYCDCLLAANGIISAKQAGKIRYLDSREDEQQKGITMESSAISVKFTMMSDNQPRQYAINLIDTPGHVDFSSQVSTASRLCDGALIMLDAVEGVCTQTIAVLSQVWKDRLRPILVINKMDRLIVELKLSPGEAYHHLSQLIENTNAAVAALYTAERMQEDDALDHELWKTLADQDLYFDPQSGNVIFSSATDGWAFRIPHFARIYAAKLGMKESNLRKCLWGDFFLDPKAKRVVSQSQLEGKNYKRMSEQFILLPLWSVYNDVMISPDATKRDKIISSLSINILPRDLKSKDPKQLLATIMSQWLPLSTCTFQAVVDSIPAPKDAQASRIPKILYPNLQTQKKEPVNGTESDMYSCNDTSSATIVAYVSRMFAVKNSDLPKNRRKVMNNAELRQKTAEIRAQHAQHTKRIDDGSSIISDNASSSFQVQHSTDVDSTNEETMIGFSRLYSGTLRRGQNVTCVLPKYKVGNTDNDSYLKTIRIDDLYMMMGRDLTAVEEVPAGNVFALAGLGLEKIILRNATICCKASTDPDEESWKINLADVLLQDTSIMRVALEPTNPSELPKLVEGLRLLAQADPCVETLVQETGEHVILTAGELHLERCLNDLRNRFAGISIQSSKPIVPFRETSTRWKDPSSARQSKGLDGCRGQFIAQSSDSSVRITTCAAPIPQEILQLLLESSSIITEIHRRTSGALQTADVSKQELKFWESLDRIAARIGGIWQNIADCIWKFGPRGVGPNILVDRSDAKRSLRKQTRRQFDFDDAILVGFQAATAAGPLCREPMQGLAFFIDKMDLGIEIGSDDANCKMPQITGSLISSSREAFKSGFLDWSPRLLLAMYSCEIQASGEVLGKVYAVVAKRKGRIISEEMRDGTFFFTVRCSIPVVESFGFADELRTKSSGAASPQLVFQGFELLDEDPFWQPTSQEELEDLGSLAERENVALSYLNEVRSRKGLQVEKKVIQHAEKQRTLKK